MVIVNILTATGVFISKTTDELSVIEVVSDKELYVVDIAIDAELMPDTLGKVKSPFPNVIKEKPICQVCVTILTDYGDY